MLQTDINTILVAAGLIIGFGGLAVLTVLSCFDID
jgi:hypothetical protein